MAFKIRKGDTGRLKLERGCKVGCSKVREGLGADVGGTAGSTLGGIAGTALGGPIGGMVGSALGGAAGSKVGSAVD